MDLLAPGARLPRRSGSLPAKPHTGRPRAGGVVRPTASMQNGGSWAQGCSSGFCASVPAREWMCEGVWMLQRGEEQERRSRRVCVWERRRGCRPPCVACPPAAQRGALAVSPGPAERHVTWIASAMSWDSVCVYVCDGCVHGTYRSRRASRRMAMTGVVGWALPAHCPHTQGEPP